MARAAANMPSFPRKAGGVYVPPDFEPNFRPSLSTPSDPAPTTPNTSTRRLNTSNISPYESIPDSGSLFTTMFAATSCPLKGKTDGVAAYVSDDASAQIASSSEGEDSTVQLESSAEVAESTAQIATSADMNQSTAQIAPSEEMHQSTAQIGPSVEVGESTALLLKASGQIAALTEVGESTALLNDLYAPTMLSEGIHINHCAVLPGEATTADITEDENSFRGPDLHIQNFPAQYGASCGTDGFAFDKQTATPALDAKQPSWPPVFDMHLNNEPGDKLEALPVQSVATSGESSQSHFMTAQSRCSEGSSSQDVSQGKWTPLTNPGPGKTEPRRNAFRMLFSCFS